MLVASPWRSVSAQFCGIDPGDNHRFRVSAGAQAYTYATAVAVELAAAGRVHGTLAIGTTRDAELDARTLDFAVEVGTGLALGPRQRFYACPSLSIVVALGPSDFLLSETDFRYLNTAVGFGVASLAVRSRRLMVIPAAGVRLARIKVTSDPSAAERASGVVAWTRSDAYWILGGNVQFVWNRRLTAQPGFSLLVGLPDSRGPDALVVPFGREEGEVSLSLTIGYNFGRRRSPAGP